MKKLLFLLLIVSGINTAFATHNRAGEITYTHITGYKYGITITTYTNTYNTTADRCELEVLFGDGDSAIASRINGPSSLCPNTHDGVMINLNTKLNIYYVEHTYPGSNNYLITMEDPNRNAGICNIPNSVNQSFFLQTELVINPFLGSNSSPVLLNPPIDDACIGECFIHNPGAYDSDGDSLSYSLTTCYANGQPIFGYSLPPNLLPTDIDILKGDLLWCSPNAICQYNVAILIKEYRLLSGSHQRYYIGSILRDMQINAGSCINTSPQIKNVNDTCVVAGTNLHFSVSATDAQVNTVKLEATGGPFQLSPAATFSSTPSLTTVTGTFNWTPNCTEVQLLPYLVTFKATDSNPTTPLVDFESVFITVVAPAPTGLTATPSGSSIIVDWNTAPCNSLTGSNPLSGYSVYRKNTCDPWVHSPCETGVPGYTGYLLIGSTDYATSVFIDNNNNQGLIHGVDYSYIIVSYYSDGSQSYASINVCAQLVRDVPIITNVSVTATDAFNGSIRTHWVKPLGNTPNLDTIANPPPYEYRLMEAQGFNPLPGAYSQVASFTYASFSQLTDTGFVNTGLNTETNSYTYRVDFYSNGLLKGSTHTASSIFLSATPGDKKVNLSWQEYVPWSNYRYDIYRETTAGSGLFTFIDSAITSSYIDTGLVNSDTYCYKIISAGKYSDPVLPRPLYNSSQLRCATPVDQQPPCQPNFTVVHDCDNLQNVLSWINPNTYCSSDAIQYNIYFSPTTDGVLQLIHSSTDMNTTTFTHIFYYEGVPSVAGCYAVTALDTVGNESPVLNKRCVDNCPVYELPNVFTPNGDNKNDFLIPLPYRYVKDIDIKIYDRWGLLMFSTTNPDILWDGKNSETKRLCSDGTYFYVCIVNEIHVDGIKQRILKGFVQLFQDKSGTNN